MIPDPAATRDAGTRSVSARPDENPSSVGSGSPPAPDRRRARGATMLTVAVAAAVGAGVAALLAPSTEADAGEHRLSVELRPLRADHEADTARQAVQAVMKSGAVKDAVFDLDRRTATVNVNAADAAPLDAMAVIEGLRAKGFEPLAVRVRLVADGKVVLRSPAFGVNDSKTDLLIALEKLRTLDTASTAFGPDRAVIPVIAGEVDVMAVLRAATAAGFAVTGLEITGTAAPPPPEPPSVRLPQPLRNICIVLGRAARFSTRYKGVDVPFCTKNCKARFEALDEAKQDLEVREAFERFGEERPSKNSKAATTPAAILPTQAELGNNCVILKGEIAKPVFTATFKGLRIPLCCKSCRTEWDSMSDEDKSRTLKEAAEK